MSYPPRVASTRNSPGRLWTVPEFHQLVKARLIGVNEPAELIAGQIIRSAPSRTRHCAGSVERLGAMLQRCVGNQGLVRSRAPVILGSHSEPKPDIAVVRGDAARYRYHNPTPVEIALLLEIADGTLTLDCGFKAAEYAQAGIQDYWVLDATRTQLHVFRDPLQGRYRQQRVLGVGESVTLFAFGTIVATLQPPVPLYFLTRQGHRSHSGDRLPLNITRHRCQPALTEVKPTDRPQPAPLHLPPKPMLEPQAVPSPRFLQPAIATRSLRGPAANPTRSDLP